MYKPPLIYEHAMIILMNFSPKIIVIVCEASKRKAKIFADTHKEEKFSETFGRVYDNCKELLVEYSNICQSEDNGPKLT